MMAISESVFLPVFSSTVGLASCCGATITARAIKFPTACIKHTHTDSRSLNTHTTAPCPASRSRDPPRRRCSTRRWRSLTIRWCTLGASAARRSHMASAASCPQRSAPMTCMHHGTTFVVNIHITVSVRAGDAAAVGILFARRCASKSDARISVNTHLE